MVVQVEVVVDDTDDHRFCVCVVVAIVVDHVVVQKLAGGLNIALAVRGQAHLNGGGTGGDGSSLTAVQAVVLIARPTLQAKNNLLILK